MIFNALGQHVAQGWVTEGQELNISNLETGYYFIQVGSYRALSFVKN
jgi:hypothetical protein